MVSVLVGCCLLLVAGHLTNGAVQTVALVSVTVSPFTLTNFTCEGNGDTLTWTVNNSPLDDTISQQRNIMATNTGDLSSVLSVVALPINNGIEIGCIITSFDPIQIAASEATLTIKGSTPIEDLNLNFSSDNSLMVSWSPPVYYAPAGFPLFYQIAVVNEEGEFIRHLNLSNITLIEISNVTECDTFNVSITGLIDQYTSATTRKRNNGSCSIDILNFSVLFGNVTAHIMVNCIPLICKRIVLVEATYNDEGVNTLLSQFVINKSNEFDQLLSNYTLKHLEPFKHYNITFKLLDLMSDIEDKDSVTISTFYVQGLSISSNNDFVLVECIFVEGLTVEGCHVTFTDKGLRLEESFNITGSGGAQISLQHSGNYTVTVYDIVNGSIIGPAFQYPIPIEFIVTVLPSPTITFHTLSALQSIINSEDLFTTTVNSTSVNSFETLKLQSSLSSSNPINVPVTTFSVKDDSNQSSADNNQSSTDNNQSSDNNNNSSASHAANIILLSAIAAAVIVVTCTIAVITVSVVILYRVKGKMNIKRPEEIIEKNPAYGQIQVRHERVSTSVNPAYSVVTFDYEMAL